MLKIKINNIDKNILTIPHLITCMFFVFSSFYIYKAKTVPQYTEDRYYQELQGVI